MLENFSDAIEYTTVHCIFENAETPLPLPWPAKTPSKPSNSTTSPGLSHVSDREKTSAPFDEVVFFYVVFVTANK